jgi:uncharacterized protein YsxB (DUF464 family)
MSDVITSVRFVVLAEASAIGFQSVSDIGKTGDFMPVTEGGNNQYPYMMKKPQETPHKLTFKRGILLRTGKNENADIKRTGGFVNPDNSLDPLKQMFGNGSIGTLLILDHAREIKAMYSFISQGITEWSLSELDATRSEPIIETISIIHNGLTSLAVPED